MQSLSAHCMGQRSAALTRHCPAGARADRATAAECSLPHHSRETPMGRVNTDASKAIGQRIRAARLELKMSQEKLGDALGVTFQQIQKYESGVNRMSADRLPLLAAVLHKSVPYLLTGQDGPSDKTTPGLSAQFFSDADGAALARIFVAAKSGVRRQIRLAAEGIAQAG